MVTFGSFLEPVVLYPLVILHVHVDLSDKELARNEKLPVQVKSK